MNADLSSAHIQFADEDVGSRVTMTFTNPAVQSWVSSVTQWLAPSEVRWIDGSENESKEINAALVKAGMFTPLNPTLYPNSFWSISDPNDVARVEDRTFICSKSADDAGPTNNWKAPAEMYAQLEKLMAGCMVGRIMYVVPYLMGPVGSPYSKVGFELTDSLYVVANMRIMARVGEPAVAALGASDNFVRGVHSVGTLKPENRYVCHFPEDNTIISFNSNYGGNALQGKKCFALRIASNQARREGWLAEHMLIVGVTNPQGKKLYFAGAFPSACGKTNLAMLIPPKSYRDAGWKVETVGDDIAWLNFGADGRLYAINPEAGFFGVAPGTSEKTNPNAIAAAHANTIFTNTALDLDTNTPWWEGLTEKTPLHLKDWNGNVWSAESGKKAAHANSRFTAPASQCPAIDPLWQIPQGVPISGIIFGGRRAHTAPLVYEARSWQHGTFLGATMASETTAAAVGKSGVLRRDPMAMLPFIGYHAADYFAHWLKIGQRDNAKLPRLFHVNWFKQNAAGKYIWPGFGDNIRVLEWMFNRIEGNAHAWDGQIGFMPKVDDLNFSGLMISAEDRRELFHLRKEDWVTEIKSQAEFFQTLGPRLPQELWDEHRKLAAAFS